MRFCFTILVLVFSLSLQAATQKLLILGDSLSAGYGMQQQQGWVHLLQQQLEKNQSSWTIINASISGETTAGGLARLPELLTKHQPQAVLIELGGNDGLRGFPAAQIEKNLQLLITEVKNHQAKPILMQIRIPPNYGPRYTRQFVALYPALAEKHQAVYWPFFMDAIAVKPELMLPDGIHPNVTAQPIIRDFIAPLLQKL
ncbi:arylesterase [Rheinheimera sp. SA_1]|jgi:acyl-CoA thioesterase-1|uniref:arylesterase n=1 Tax=Rheinheimera sp. SA_1 TaxID=1827365 RepID=UPI0007FC1547|nr:arylesterase [Rheinheimera sp. SA_1]OBP14600.1 arylesterase [Rheinheimera sp. SA_1]